LCFLVYSTQIFSVILHHNFVLLFSCFCNKILFEPTSCTNCVLVLGFHVPWFGLKLGLPLSCDWFVSFINPFVLVVFMFVGIWTHSHYLYLYYSCHFCYPSCLITMYISRKEVVASMEKATIPSKGTANKLIW
jgi:hypothetical protein